MAEYLTKEQEAEARLATRTCGRGNEMVSLGVWVGCGKSLLLEAYYLPGNVLEGLALVCVRHGWVPWGDTEVKK